MEEILDDQHETQPSPPWWPSVVMGGLTGGGLLTLFQLITRKGGAVIVIYLITIFIVQNSTLNHYRSKLGSSKTFLTAFNICCATYVLMVFTTYAITYLWLSDGRQLSWAIIFNFATHLGPQIIGAGILISGLTAFLSKRPGQ